jgi:hypothetical protein
MKKNRDYKVILLNVFGFLLTALFLVGFIGLIFSI